MLAIPPQNDAASIALSVLLTRRSANEKRVTALDCLPASLAKANVPPWAAICCCRTLAVEFLKDGLLFNDLAWLVALQALPSIGIEPRLEPGRFMESATLIAVLTTHAATW